MSASIVPVIDDDHYLNLFKYSDRQINLLIKTEIQVIQVIVHPLVALRSDGTVIYLEVNDDRSYQVKELQDNVKMISGQLGLSEVVTLDHDDNVSIIYQLENGGKIDHKFSRDEGIIKLADSVVFSETHIYRLHQHAGLKYPYPVSGQEAETTIVDGNISLVGDTLYWTILRYDDEVPNISYMPSCYRYDVGRVLKASSKNGLIVLNDQYDLHVSGGDGYSKIELTRSDVVDYYHLSGSLRTVPVGYRGDPNLLTLDTRHLLLVLGDGDLIFWNAGDEQVVTTGMLRLPGSDPINRQHRIASAQF